MEYIIAFSIGVIIMICVFFVFKNNHQDPHVIKSLLLENDQRQQQALFVLQQEMQEQMLKMQNSMKTELQSMKDATNEHLYLMEKNMHTSVHQNFESTSKVFTQVMEKMTKLDEGQQNLKELSYSINDIQRVLTDKKTRGIFGEIELYSLLENSMGVNSQRYSKQYKLSNGSLVDAVVFAKDPLMKICIDSKFPLENYNRIMDASTKEEQNKYHNAFVADCKKHIKAIATKYIIPHETADFAYMFIPAEAIFAYVYAQCEDIVKYSYEQKVYIVSPTTLMAYITAIKAIYLGVEQNENLASMQHELQKLQLEFERFDKRFQSIQNDFEKSYQDMRLLAITASKLTNRFHEIANVNLDNNKETKVD